MPLLYMPIFYYPVQKDDRATGFLHPGLRGVDDPRAVAEQRVLLGDQPQPGPDAHARLVLEDGPGLRHRVPLRPRAGLRRVRCGSTGCASTRPSTTTRSRPARQSYEVRGAGTQRLSNSVRARFRADYFSDIEVQQTYHQNVYDASRRQRVFSGSVSGAWREYNAHRHGRPQRVLLRHDELERCAAARRACSINRNERPLFGQPRVPVGEQRVQPAHRRAEDGRRSFVDQSLTRFDLLPRIRIPFTKWQFLTANSTAAFRTTYWTESRDPQGQQIEQGISRNYYELQSQVTGPVLNRIWSFPGNAYAEKLKHSIQPYFNIQRVSAVDNFDQIVQIDGADTIVGNTTRVGYGVDQPRVSASRPAVGSRERS